MVVDFLSRLNVGSESMPIEDSFPDEYIFSISVHSLLYVDIANHVATGKISQHLSYNKKRRIIQQSARYSWLEGNPYHTRPNHQIRRCVREDEIFYILRSCHEKPCRGHFVDKGTGYKVFSTGNYWPTIL